MTGDDYWQIEMIEMDFEKVTWYPAFTPLEQILLTF